METKNLLKVSNEDENNTFDLAFEEDSQVECLHIVDIAERSHFHFIIRSKSSVSDEKSIELKGTDNNLAAGDSIALSTLVIGDKFRWTFSLKEGQNEPLDILVKVKLLKNLKDPSPANNKPSSDRVTWRFELNSENVEIVKALQLMDICSEIEFSYKLASGQALK